MTKELKWASLVSGGGTTMREMAQATQSGEVSGVKLDLVISSTARAGAIRKAQELGLEPGQIVVINPNNFKGEDGVVDQDEFGRQILIQLKKRGIDFFTQNGWLKHTPTRVLEEFEGFNQHPQDPRYFGGPDMYGLRTHAARLIYSQVTAEKEPSAIPVVHRVTEGYDEGAVVVFDSTKIPEDVLERGVVAEGGAEALQQVVLPLEHQVNIELLRQMATGTVHDVQLPDMAPIRISRGGDKSRDQWADYARTQAIALFPHA